MTRRATTSTLLALLALLLLGGPALAGSRGADATYPPGPHAVLGVLSQQTIRDGAEVVMSGDGFRGGSLLTVTLDGEPYSTLRAEASGSFQITVRISGPGTRLLAVSGTEPDGRQRIVSDPVTVLSASESLLPTPSPEVATPTASRKVSTGSTVMSLFAGLGLVVLFGATRLLLRARSDRS